MLSTKDHATMTNEELMAEEKKMKSQKTMNALLIGFLGGVAVWSATHKSFMTTICLLIVLLLIVKRNTKQEESLKAALNSRKEGAE